MARFIRYGNKEWSTIINVDNISYVVDDRWMLSTHERTCLGVSVVMVDGKIIGVSEKNVDEFYEKVLEMKRL